MTTGACSHGGIYSVDHKKVRVDFSSNVNPLGAPKKAVRVIERQAGRLAPVYPDPECLDLKKGLSRRLGFDTGHITVGNGAAEIIYWFAQAFAGKRVVIPAPTFCEYELASEKAGAEVTFVPLSADFALDAEAVTKSARGADAVFLCNPNNPTGLLATDAVRKVVDGVDPSTTRILLDECFIELVDKPKENTLADMVRKHENLVVLRSLTKSFGMAGLRLGYSISSPALAKEMQARKTPWNVNGLAQAAGIAALADRGHIARARALVARERRFLHDRIRKAGFLPIKSDANYFLVQIKGDSTEFRDRLLKKTGVLVRDCSTFTGMRDRHIRVAIKTHKENVALVKALEAMVSGG
nr:threonine-phosphate decarboxylase [uncultured Nitrososphaera sp.]